MMAKLKRAPCGGWSRSRREQVIVARGVEDPRFPGEKFYVCPQCGRSVRMKGDGSSRDHTPLGRAEQLQAEAAYALPR
jgi:hypothetical protein